MSNAKVRHRRRRRRYSAIDSDFLKKLDVSDFSKIDYRKLEEYFRTKSGLTLLGAGRHRATFDLQNGWVLKVPRSEMGVSSNYLENSTYLQYRGADHVEFKYAKCYMYNEIFLIMENVVSYHKSRFHKGKLPGWADYIDCRQVGYNKDGVLVAYDFGR